MKVVFLNDLQYGSIPGEPYWWYLIDDLEYEVRFDVGDLGEWFRWQTRVPANFVTDLASIPRFLWSFFPPMGEYSAAAVIHDWRYHRRLGTRQLADELFRASMKALGVSWWKRNAFYAAVRLFGKKAWETDSDKPTI